MPLVAAAEDVRRLAAQPGAERRRQPQHHCHRQPRLGRRQAVAAAEEADRPQRLAIAEEGGDRSGDLDPRSEEHTSELQSLMRTSYAVFRLNKNTHNLNIANTETHRCQRFMSKKSQ